MSKTQNETAGQKSFELTVKHLKREAKRLAKETSIPHSQALDAIAQKNGYRNWSLLAKSGGSLRIESGITPPELAQPVELKPEVKPTTEELLLQLIKNYETDTPNPRPDLSKKKFLTLTKIGREFALSAAKTKKVLAENGLLDLLSNKPTEKATEIGAYEEKQMEDKYHGKGLVSYYVWDFNIVSKFFEKPDALTHFLHIPNRHKAAEKFEDLIIDAAEALGLQKFYIDTHFYDEFDDDEATSEARDTKLQEDDKKFATSLGISECTYTAITDAIFDDYVASGAFDFVDDKEHWASMRKSHEHAVEEIYGALKKKKKLKAKAEFFKAAATGVLDWMDKQI